MKIFKVMIAICVLLLGCVLQTHAADKMLFKITSAKGKGKLIYPSMTVAVGKKCKIKVDEGDGKIVDFKPSNYSSVELKGETVTFYCDHPEYITFINASFSKATALDFSGAVGCKEINMFVNELPAKSMAACMASLPKTTDGKITVKNFTNTNDKSVIYKSHVATAKEKGWTVYAFSDVVEKKAPYEGEADPVAPPVVQKEKMLFKITSAKGKDKMIYPSMTIADGKNCKIKVDEGDGKIVDFKPSKYSSVELKGETVTFYCDHPEYITFINTSFSKATALDLSGAVGCKEINIFVNELSAKAMAACMASLPKTTSGVITAKCFTNTNDKNVIYKSHVATAKEKGWTVYAFSGSVGNKQPYEGENEGGTVTEEPNVTMKSSGNAIVLKVKGTGKMEWTTQGGDKQELIAGINFLNGVKNKQVLLTGDFTEMVCFQSDLTELEIKKAPNLVYLNCCANRLNENAMKKLVASLPDNNNIEKRLVAIDTKNEYEGNYLSDNLVADAIKKNWKVLDWNGGEPTPYKAPVPAIMISTLKQKGDMVQMAFKGKGKLMLDMGDGNLVKVDNKDNIYELKGTYIHVYGEVEIADLSNVAATAIDATNAAVLKELDCSLNRLDDAAFTRFVASLVTCPKSAKGKIIAIDSDNAAERNVVSKTNVALLLKKNWQVFANTTNGLKEYAGIAVTPKEPLAVKMQTTLEKGKEIKIFAEGITDLWADMGDEVLVRLSKTGHNTLIVKDKEIKIYGNLTWFAVQEASLTNFELVKAPNLLSLFVNKNNLEMLDVSAATKLEFLNCADNNIKGKAMDALVESLTDATGYKRKAQLYIIDSTTKGEKDNIATQEQCKKATDKGWEVRDFNGGQDDKPIYEGEDPNGISSLSATKARIYTNPNSKQIFVEYPVAKLRTIDVYSIDGRKMETRIHTDNINNTTIDCTQLQKGLYIVRVGEYSQKVMIK